MVALPTRYYVQRSQTDSAYGPPRGWETVIVTFDRGTADSYASSFENAVLFEDGMNVSEVVATWARVVTADELRAESEETLAQAEAETRIQLWQKLAEWAEPLVAPDHA
jgi:hypothetical protein